MLIAAHALSLAIPLVVGGAMVGVGGADRLGTTWQGNSRPQMGREWTRIDGLGEGCRRW